jgi:hypothetical protein
MVGVRVTMLALVACRSHDADAQPAAFAPPAGWRALPELASAVGSAANANDGALAWGEPAMGCYAVSIALRGGGAPDAIVDGLRAAGFTVTDATVGDATTLAFARGDYRGRLRADLDGDRVTARACFWNDREPDACARACAEVMR